MRHAAAMDTQHSRFLYTPLQVLTQNPAEAAAVSSRQVLRRRPTPAQGAALEVLGHAIEYLEDTNFHAHRSGDPALAEAIRILSQGSRAVFHAIPPAAPATHPALRWLPSCLRVVKP